MKRRLFLALLLLTASTPVYAQAITRLANQSASGNLTTNGDTLALPVPVGVGFGSIGVEARGTWTGTIEIQCAASTGGGSFVALTLAPRNSTTLVTSFTANGQWSASIAGCQRVQAAATAAMTGTATVTLVGTFTAYPTATGVTGGGIVTAAQLLAPDGTAPAPSYSFASAPTSGLFTVPADANSVYVGIAGTARVRIVGSSFIFADTEALQWGSSGTSSADVSLSRGAADVLALATGDSFNMVGGGGSFRMANVPIISSTAPTVTSAGTNPSVAGTNTAAFRVNVGTGGAATTIVMAMPAATTGWNCHADNITAGAANRANQRVIQQSSTTTAVTVQNQTISTGAALAFTANDIVAFVCMAY